jgi:hypothetical protein
VLVNRIETNGGALGSGRLLSPSLVSKLKAAIALSSYLQAICRHETWTHGA